MSETKKKETTGSARWWDKRKATYLDLGLCHRCAAQAAYGHRHGFSTVHPPCEACASVVATFGTAVGNGWRKHVPTRSPETVRADLKILPTEAGGMTPGKAHTPLRNSHSNSERGAA